MAVYQTLSVKEISVDTLANTSRVQILWKSQQTGESHNDNTRTAKYWITVNGEKTEYTVSYTLPAKTTKTILSKTVTVPHKSDGTGTVKVQTWMDTRISAGEVELSKSLTLTAIPRASTIGATDAFVESTAVIAVSRKSKEYTHSIAFSFGALSGYLDADGAIADGEVKHTATNIPFVIPAAFYDQMQTEKSKKCQLICRTYKDNSQIGSDQSAAFTVSAREELCRPVVQAQVQDVNPLTVELTGNAEVLIRHMSNAQCQMRAQGQNGAAIVTQSINGQQVDGSLLLGNIEVADFTFAAQDSRGFITTQTVTKTLIPYIPVTLNAKVTRTDPTSGNGILEVSGQCYAGSFGVKSNTLTLTYQVNDGEEQTAQILLDESGLRYTARENLTGLDYLVSSTVQITLEDTLSKATQSVTVKPGVPVFDWGQKDFCFHVPASMDHHRITDLLQPQEDLDAVNKSYADSKISITKVWVNEAPDQAFPAQTLAIPFESNEMALVFFADGIDARAQSFLLAEFGHTCRVIGRYGSRISQRGVKAQAEGLYIDGGSRMLTYGEWSSTDEVMIPVAVYKIRGVGAAI